MENKEATKTNAATQTAVEEPTAQEVKNEEKSYEGDLKDLIGEGKYNISAPLFLMFAEYLGYVGKTLPWIDQWCVAKKKFTEKKLRELYDSLYEVILFIYDDNLKEMAKEEQEKADRTTA